MGDGIVFGETERQTSLTTVVSSAVKKWHAPRQNLGLLGRRPVQVGLAVLSVIVLLTSNYTLTHTAKASSTKPALLALQPQGPPYYPYLTSATDFPLPDFLANQTGATYLPKVTSAAAFGQLVYQVLYAVNVTGVGSILESDIGTYNASMAQKIFQAHDCQLACSQHLPIVWQAPTPLAVFGSAMIEGDAEASWSSCLAVAATVNEETSVFVSYNYGSPGSWYELTGNEPVPGGSPQLVAAGGGVDLTTLSPTLRAVSIPYPQDGGCTLTAVPPPPGGRQQGRPLQPGPVISGIVPYQATAGTYVSINGTGLGTPSQVLFGGIPSTSYSYSAPSIVARVPSGSGVVPVQVVVNGMMSPVTCQSHFSYGTTLSQGTPEVFSVTPTGGLPGTSVTIDGAYFTQTSKVYFGSIQATNVVLQSTGVLIATVPTSNGTVDVTVVNSVGTSPKTCADAYSYQPVVSGVIADRSSAGTTVSVFGNYFNVSSTIEFGGASAAKVTYVSGTELEAKVPSGSGVVNVTVHDGSYVSSKSCSSEFAYGAAPATNAPEILSLARSAAPTGNLLTINGVNLTPPIRVTFGGVPAELWQVNSSSQIEVVVPPGLGRVPVQVENEFDLSLPTCNDVFTIQEPRSASPQRLATFGSAFSDSLSLGPTGAIIVAGNETTSSVRLYSQWSNGAWSFNSRTVIGFNVSDGPGVFDTLGGTTLDVSNPSPGQVALAGNSTSSMLMYTTNSRGRTVGMSLVTSNGGATWEGPYLVGDTIGSVTDPQLAFSPAGYFFAAWLSAQGGGWTIDEASYSPSGNLLIAPAGVPGTNYTSGLENASLALTSDAFNRPILAWDAMNSTSDASVTYTGGFVSPFAELDLAESGWADTKIPDFQHYPSGSINQFQLKVDGTFSNLSAQLNSFALCGSLQTAIEQVYVNATLEDAVPIIAGPPVPGCPIPPASSWIDNSILANVGGPTEPNTYLSVEIELLLEGLGFGEFAPPAWIYWNSTSTSTKAYQPDTGGIVRLNSANFVAIHPATVNPSTLWLNTSYKAYSNHTVVWYHEPVPGGYENCGWNSTSYAPREYWSNDTVRPVGWPTVSQNFWSPKILPSPHVTELYGLNNGTWFANDTILWQSRSTSVTYCPASLGFKNYSGPSSAPFTWTFFLDGKFTTGLSTSPSALVVNSTAVSKTLANDTIQWNNTVWAHADAWLNSTTHNALWENTSDLGHDYVEGSGFQAVPANVRYTLTVEAQTGMGSTDGSWWPIINANEMSSVPREKTGFTCTFTQFADPLPIWLVPNDNETNISTTSATITWFTPNILGAAARGWVTAQDSAGVTIAAYAQASLLLNNSYEYQAELHGLQAWGAYNLVIREQSLPAPNDCMSYSSNTSAFPLQLAAIFPVAEQDMPYDSITHQGGGATVYWQVPTNFTLNAQYINGTLIAAQTSNTSNVSSYPIGNLSPVADSPFQSEGGRSVNTTYAVNVTGLTPNTDYSVSMFLNYSIPQPGGLRGILTATNAPYEFTYLRDTSGDGLTDTEKAQGWNVTVQASTGQTYVRHVNASVPLYSTNGLVGDLLEKQFGLDPHTLDTAGSHMLDTWNLTFDLGTSASCPTYFKCWYLNTTNPFTNDPYPGHPGTGSPASYNSTGPHTKVDDSSPYDATVLWQGTTLQYLQSLIHHGTDGWLRAMVGKFPSTIDSGHYTLTVWGKLSWGANPLASSTVSDGIPDGYRVSPLGETDVNVTVAGWLDSGLTQGDGVAAYIRAVSNSSPYFYQRTDYSGYTSQVTALSNGSADYGGAFTVTFPVTPTEQHATLNLTLVQNTGSGGNNVFSNAVGTGPIYVDLSNLTMQSNRSVHSSDVLKITYQVVPIYWKAPTAIVMPGDNSTLSSLPLGLSRYVGEQDFVLLEANLNASATGDSSLSVSGLPYPNVTAANEVSGSYTFGVASGMTNILVPRNLFVHSALGQALMLNKTNASIPASGYNGFLRNSWDPANWQARVLNYTQWNGSDYLPGNLGYIKVYSNTDQNCTVSRECGGIPSKPSAEAGVPSFAVQAIFTLNFTSQADLDGLLAGLLLNKSGNFSNWIFAATQYLPTLGLSPTVLSALANSTQSNDGAYGAPTSNQKAPESWWQAAASTIWNAVSGVIGALSVIWSAIVAATAYIVDLVARIASWGLAALKQTASVLKQVEGAMVYLMDQILSVIVAGVKAVFSPITTAITNVMKAYVESVWSVLTPAWNAYNSTGSVTSAESLAFVDNFFGSPVLVALAIATAVTIAFVIVQSLSVGADFLANIVISLLVSAILGVAVAFVMSLVPAFAISEATASSAWFLFNESQSGIIPFGTRIGVLGSALCPIFGVIGATFAGYHAGTLLGGDSIPESVKLVENVRANGFSVLDLVGAYPIIELTLGAVGLAMGVISKVVGGEKGVVFAGAGLVVSLVALTYGGLLLAKRAGQLRLSNMYTSVLTAEVMGAVGLGFELDVLMYGC